jgi:hypothetical protein
VTERLEAIFVEQVKKSWDIHSEVTYASSVDDILLGAVIAGTVNIGYSLIDLVSDGTRHYLRFEDTRNNERLTFRLEHRTGDLVAAKSLGHLADVTIGFGCKVADSGVLWGTFKQEMKSIFIMSQEPGVVTLDADVTGGYIYAQVGLIWALEEYMRAPYEPDFAKLGEHINACKVSLQKYLQGRLKDTVATREGEA